MVNVKIGNQLRKAQWQAQPHPFGISSWISSPLTAWFFQFWLLTFSPSSFSIPQRSLYPIQTKHNHAKPSAPSRFMNKVLQIQNVGIPSKDWRPPFVHIESSMGPFTIEFLAFEKTCQKFDCFFLKICAIFSMIFFKTEEKLTFKFIL